MPWVHPHSIPLSLLVQEGIMDGRRSRRTKDPARRLWYACYRQVRFARWLGFADGSPARAIARWQGSARR